MTLTAAVLTISDSCAAGTRADRSGPSVCDRLQSLGWKVTVREVLPDDANVIAERLRTLCTEGQCRAVFTTGGTGVAPRDVTPEATRAVIDREIPGFGELMRLRGIEQTPRATLSRGLAGLCGRTLVVNLPGTPRGALHSLDAIVDLVPHVVDLASGNTEHSGVETA
jgi:molybdopterin adenylyltransferase